LKIPDYGQMKIPTIGRIQKNHPGKPRVAFQFPSYEAGTVFKIPAYRQDVF